MKELIDTLSFPRAYVDAFLLLAAVVLALWVLRRLKTNYHLANTGWIAAGLWLYIPVWLIDNICRVTKSYDFYNPPGAYLWIFWGALRITCLCLFIIGLIGILKQTARKDSASAFTRSLALPAQNDA